VTKVSKYTIIEGREIIKTTTLYADGKTQVPKKVIQLLKLEHGSQIVWIKEANKIIIESPRT
jgi:hypothetical protein